jgi:hypothetical protein
MERATTRRTVLNMLAGLPLLAAVPVHAREGSLIGRLISEAQPLPQMSRRIDFISRSLLGHPLSGPHADRRSRPPGGVRGA